MKFHILFIIMATTACQVYAQDSVIEEMMHIQQALVEVMAENTDVFTGGQARAGIDPQTGHMVIARKSRLQAYQRSGAGIIIHPDGIIVTNAHTGSKANAIKITLNTGETFFAQPVGLINDLDLLLVKINAGRQLPFVNFANSDDIQLGQEVITIGNSSLLKNTISGGIIIGIGMNRKLKYIGKHRTDLIQTTVNLYQGDSGGPLFDNHGQLIGLMTADEGATDHSSFAIPSNKIRESLLEYLNNNDN